MGAIRVWLWAMVLLGPAGWVAYRVWPRELGYRAATLIPVCHQSGGRPVVTLPDRFLVAKVARYDDELYAHLMFTYLKASSAFQDNELFLTFRKSSRAIDYDIQVHLANDLLSSIRPAGARQNERTDLVL